MQLTRYDAARNAVQICSNVDDAKDILDKVSALQAYAKQQKDTEMEAWVAEIKIRARRRIGELSKGLEKAKPGGAGGGSELPSGGQLAKSATLKAAGLSHSVAQRCEKIAEIAEEKFEEVISKAKKAHKVVTSVSVEKEIVKKEKKEKRTNEIQSQKDAIKNSERVPLEKEYHVISIDPPWPYEKNETTSYDSEGRRVANPYPEMSIPDIAAMTIPSADDCVLWLWTTHKFLPDAFGLLSEWEFDYKATLVWDKQKIGMGHWLRMQCEFCLLAVKGKPVWDNTTVRDLLSSPRREHSRKPDAFFEMVDGICVGAKLDYFSREKREGWDQIGNDKGKF